MSQRSSDLIQHSSELAQTCFTSCGSRFLQLRLHTINGIISTTGKPQLNSCVYTFPMATQFCADCQALWSDAVISFRWSSPSGLALLRKL